MYLVEQVLLRQLASRVNLQFFIDTYVVMLGDLVNYRVSTARVEHSLLDGALVPRHTVDEY